VEAKSLASLFQKHFPESGTPFLCRVPGRINLLGEHLDYNGLPVLPMAIDRAITIAFAGRATPEIHLRNADERFPEVRFANGADLEPSPLGDWDNYCKAALEGLNKRFGVKKFPGMDVLVYSDLPPAAGLSSSSALVVAFAMAYLAILDYTLGKDINRLELAGVLANAEQFVGTAGGGMDQTVILNAAEGHATKINFIPFQFEQIPLPEKAAFIVCDSMVESSKTGNALAKYNAGPAACSLITNMLNTHFLRAFGEDFSIDCIGDLWLGSLCFNRAEVEKLLAEVLPNPYTTISELFIYLRMDPAIVREYWLDHIPVEPEGLPLQARARHVFTEYYRVEEARDALLSGDLATFGRLMNESHASCAEDYGISTPEMDDLAHILREAGCLGARLTGAGFGGAVIGLAPLARMAQVEKAVKEKYYCERLGFAGEAPIFFARSSDGARYLSQF
jgi:N-acetylgalactosamine kinase